MKKFVRFSLCALCLILMVQMLPLTAMAQATTQATMPTIPTTEETLPLGGNAPIGAAQDLPFGTVSVQNGCRTIEGMVPLGGGDQILDTAKAAFLYEETTDTVVYSYNPDMKLAPGSLAKLTTAIVAMQYCDLDDVMTVAPGIKGRIPGGAMRIDLTSDEQISIRDLMYALLMGTANDAAVALAEHVAGNRQSFVPLMNKWVKDIGCTGTEFATVHGVDGGQSVTTARDMAKIMREASRNEEFMEIMATTKHIIPATNASKERELKTNNYLIDNRVLPQFFDTRVIGGTPGYEESSGACIVAVAQNSAGLRYIGVVMGCVRVFNAEQTWKVDTYGNFEEISKLFKYGFEKFKTNRVLYDGMTMNQIKVAGGECNAVALCQTNVDSVVPKNAQMRNLTINVKAEGGGLSAPIDAGEKIGVVEIWYRNSCMAEAEVVAMGNVRSIKNTGVEVHSAALKKQGGSDILSTIGTICVIGLGLAAAYLAFNSFMRNRARAQRRRRRADRRRNR